MKPTINIIPPPNSATHLLAEIGWNGATFIWLGPNHHIEGISNFVFQENETDKLNQLAEVLQLLDSYNNRKNVFYNFAEFVLIPASFLKDDSGRAILDLQYPLGADDVVLIDAINAFKNIYAIPKVLHNMILQKSIPFIHSASCQLNEPDGLYAIFYQNTLKLILNQYGKLQFIQQFSFQDAQEAAYLILNICRQHELDAEEETLRIAGMIDEASPLYKEIAKYFNVRFAVFENMSKAESLAAYPDHFFYHLMALSSCVS